MTYKILSLDGGGPWALIQACVLADLFPNENGHQILGHFDLAIGNSGGSITLAGLIKDLPPSDIRDLFLQQANRDQIFKRTSLVGYFIDKQLGIGPKWDTQAKFAGLCALMDTDNGPRVANLKFSVLTDFVETTTNRKTQIIITAYEYDLNREIFFCSQPSLLSNLSGFDPTLAGATHASSNAPINYFDAPAIVASRNGNGARRFWDGAVGGYNNPILHGVMEALAKGHKPEEIIGLSIGTATVWQPMGKPAQGESRELFRTPSDPSTLGDITKMAEAILDDPPDASTLNAHVVTGASDTATRIIRLNPIVGPQLTAAGWKLPAGFSNFMDSNRQPIHDLDAFTYLRDMPMDAADQDSVNLIHQLAQLWISGTILNQPIRSDLITGRCLVGHPDYLAAKKAWGDLQ